MPTNRDPLAAHSIAADMLACVETKLADTWAQYPDLLHPDAAVPPRSCVISGGIAWDNCECGQLVIAIGRDYPSRSFPQAAVDTADTLSQSKCGAPFIVFDYLINILRCAPTGGDDASPPACEALDLAAQITTIDAWALRQGVWCCLRDLATQRDEKGHKYLLDFQVGQQDKVGPDGMCQGSQMRILVGINNPCPCKPLDENS